MKPTTTPPKTYRVKSFGCQMNVYDGERMAEMLDAQGITPAPEGEDADLVVLNTCHIREKAAEKIYSDIGRLTKGKTQAKPPMIAVAGCVAQAEGEEIMKRSPAVSMVVGPQAYHRLPEMLGRAVQGERATDTDMPAIAKFAALPERRRIGPTAFLTVQEGCDKFCTYCVVPYTRGAEISRPYSDLVTEARKLVEAGAKEITLLCQNVSAWGGENDRGHAVGLAGLIRDIAAIDGLARIRYTTSHPADMDDELIAAHGDTPKLMPFLHLPVQAGSDRVLKAMNRSHSVASYLALLDRFRAARSAVMMTSDVTARGVDFDDVTLVVQMGVPSNREQYIHRLGRTGRAGKTGEGVLVLSPEESFFAKKDIADLPLLPQNREATRRLLFFAR